jgi:hypothetical protein
MLGMWKGGRKETPMKLHLVHHTFINITITNTFIVYFAGRDSLAQSQCASDNHRLFCRNGQYLLKGEAQARSVVRSTFTGVELTREFNGHHRLQVTGGPSE